MRNSFFSRKNDSTATTCAAGFACSDANTNNNSVLLLTITLCLQCRFLLYSAFWHYAANRTRQTGIRGITRQHLVYQESAPTVLVGPIFVV